MFWIADFLRVNSLGILKSGLRLGFIGAIVGTLISHEPASQDKFNELLVRSNARLGAEKPMGHPAGGYQSRF